MKKIAFIILLFSIFAGGFSALAEDAILHSLWGLEFGMSREECVDAVYRNTGIVLIDDDNTISGNPGSLMSMESQSIDFLGFPVSKIVLGIYQEALWGSVDIDFLTVSEAYDDEKTIKNKGVQKIQEINATHQIILTHLVEKLGEPTYQRMSFSRYPSGSLFNSKGHEWEECYLPDEEGKATAFDSLISLESEYRFIEFEYIFNNVRASFIYFCIPQAKTDEVRLECQASISFSEYSHTIYRSEELQNFEDSSMFADTKSVSVGF